MTPAIPKPPPRKLERQRKRRHDGQWVKSVRQQVFERDGGCRACQFLGTDPDMMFDLHMHELIYRSKTRGKPIKERVNTMICVMLCARCHREVHEKRLSVHVADVKRGAEGRLMFKLWGGD